MEKRAQKDLHHGIIMIPPAPNFRPRCREQNLRLDPFHAEDPSQGRQPVGVHTIQQIMHMIIPELFELLIPRPGGTRDSLKAFRDINKPCFEHPPAVKMGNLGHFPNLLKGVDVHMADHPGCRLLHVDCGIVAVETHSHFMQKSKYGC